MSAGQLTHVECLENRLGSIVLDSQANMMLNHALGQASHDVVHLRGTLGRRAHLVLMVTVLTACQERFQDEVNIRLLIVIRHLLSSLAQLPDTLELGRVGVLVPRVLDHNIHVLFKTTKVLFHKELVPELHLRVHELGDDLAHAATLAEYLLELFVRNSLNLVFARGGITVRHVRVFRGVEVDVLHHHLNTHIGRDSVSADEGNTALGDLAVGAAVLGVVRDLDTVTAGEVVVAAGRMAGGVLQSELLDGVSVLQLGSRVDSCLVGSWLGRYRGRVDR
jgi:hypothetical protein